MDNDNLNKLRQNWYGASILILGFGREGKDTLKFLKKVFPQKTISVADAKLDKNYLKTIDNYDVVIKSPGVPIHLPEVEKAYKRSKVTSQTEIFLENCPGKIIGVTGTKGKSTTSFWIYQILKRAGFGVKLVGNIGKPALSHLLGAKPRDIFVYEMSSHQLYGLKSSPHVAVLLNIYPEHLDYYQTLKEYTLAKANITKFQKKTDYFIYNSLSETCRKIAKGSFAQKIPIRGRYYELNKAAAIAAALIFGARGCIKFKTLPHRLEFVGELGKIRFYNDSLSTIPQAATLALEHLGPDVETVILGGFYRGQEFGNLAKKILSSKIKSVILFPTSGEKIWQAILKYQRNPSAVNHFFVNNMADAVKLAYEHTGANKICLLSPASPSFGIFKDYRERGNLFKKYVKLYGKKISSSSP
ncbi:MAG: hypothetical protein G01um101430_181 [Parcubacteria group bacterium Gr01-1014_30]|nr:MAG: hypothetical protein G01um101430_181 [Parcubacteria group bacterium Gr01-1014_30]